MVEFFYERGLCMVNTYFEHKSLHKYTRVVGMDVLMKGLLKVFGCGSAMGRASRKIGLLRGCM